MRNHLVPRLLVLLLLSCAPGAFALKVERLSPTGPAAVSAPGSPSPARLGREVAGGRAFVKFSAGISSQTAAATLAAAGFTLVKAGYPGGLCLAGLPEGMRVETALPILRALPGAESAEPSGVYRAKRKSDDPYLAQQYGFRLADVFRAWDYDTGSSTRVTVAVIDTGIDGTHPELASKLSDVSQFFDPGLGGAQSVNNPPTPACNHATRVSGVAAASSNNGSGIAGLSWGARLLSLKVFDDADCLSDCTNAACATVDSAIADAVDYAVTLHNSASTGKMVLNISLGEEFQVCADPIKTAISNAVTAGLVVIVAAGNNPSAGVDSPANCTGAVPVGATDINDLIASFSARGGEMASGGVAAPGVEVYTTDLHGGYANADGTSFASPFVAGLAALLWSANPSLTNDQIVNFLRVSAADRGAAGPDSIYGYGRVDAFKAMLYAKNGSAAGYTSRPELDKAYAYPNPYTFSSGRPLSFSMPDDLLALDLEVTIYTAEGEKIKKVTSPVWDGTNEAGHKVASGVYLFFMKTDKGTARGKFAVLR
jgi:subtilisin family serine protease